MKTKRQKLFDYFAQEHDIMLLDSDFNEIELMLAEPHLPTKTKEEIKNEIAKDNNFDSFEIAIRYLFTLELLQSEWVFLNKIIDESMEEYAQQSQTTLDIISQIEGMKHTPAMSEGQYIVNDTLTEVLSILRQSKPGVESPGKTVIKAKALRKKGTNEWYSTRENLDFKKSLLPDLWGRDWTQEEIEQKYDIPSDAELIDIEIIVQP